MKDMLTIICVFGTIFITEYTTTMYFYYLYFIISKFETTQIYRMNIIQWVDEKKCYPFEPDDQCKDYLLTRIR